MTTGRRPAAAGGTRDVDVVSHRVAVTERGAQPTAQTPAVVVLPGAGDCQDSWAPIAVRLAEHTRVITYDRAGIGRSERGPAPTAEGYLTELQAVRDACVPDGRYVLVGHSLGGLIARLHAQAHPERLAGLVQVDATPEDVADDPGVRIGFAVSGALAAVLKALAPLGLVRLLLRLRALPLYPEQRTFEARLNDDEVAAWRAAVDRSTGPGGATGPELRSVLPCAREAQRLLHGVAQPQFGDLPLAVLTSRAWGDTWVDMQRRLVDRSRAATHTVFDDRHHNVHLAHPDAVVHAVADVIQRVSADASR
jgi:pimeloyl-ACP methyl ester carboxylesterase